MKIYQVKKHLHIFLFITTLKRVVFKNRVFKLTLIIIKIDLSSYNIVFIDFTYDLNFGIKINFMPMINVDFVIIAIFMVDYLITLKINFVK